MPQFTAEEAGVEEMEDEEDSDDILVGYDDDEEDIDEFLDEFLDE